MILYNIKHPNEQVNFKQAVLQGIGHDNGLFLPETLNKIDNIPALLNMDFITRSHYLMQQLLNDELGEGLVQECVDNALNFPIATKQISHNIYALELFHGPTLAFKDFGARFMAQMLSKFTDKKITIVTATSGDTGAAVAHAFYNVPNVNVVILYPHNKISKLQEKIFCTLGGNIHTIAVESDFDTCQSLVKQCFLDDSLGININSANSINIGRLLAQIVYYFEAVAALYQDIGEQSLDNIKISVPCGNFGNLTAGLLAKSLGLNIHSFIAATNTNDTIPRFLASGNWEPHPTVATMSNAMDISTPNNWPRTVEICKQQNWHIHDVINAVSISEDATKTAMRSLYKQDYLACPHSAVAYQALIGNLPKEQYGIFLCTAHPAKFKDTVDNILNIDLELPNEMKSLVDKQILSKTILPEYEALKAELLGC